MRNSWQPSSIPVPCLSAPRGVCDSHSVRQTSPSRARHGQDTLIPPSPSRNHHTELQWGIWVPGAPFCSIGFCLCCLLLTSFPETCSPLLPLAAPSQPHSHSGCALLSPNPNLNPGLDPNPNPTQCPGPTLTPPGLLLSCWPLSYQGAPAEMSLYVLETEMCT